MADLKDEFGNPIQLTDEHGNPVQLTDEHGSPVKLIGIATTETTTDVTKTTTFEPEEPPRGAQLDTGGIESAKATAGAVTEVHGDTEKAEIVGEGDEGCEQKQQEEKEQGTERSTSTSSSGTSEEDEHGVRTKKKKKKGLTQKIKEKLTGGKHKEKEEQHPQITEVTGSNIISPTTTGQHNEHEKKNMIEKIKEKLPGHHSQ